MSSDNNSVFLYGGLAALALWLFGSSEKSPAAPVVQSQPAPTSQPAPQTAKGCDEKSPDRQDRQAGPAGPDLQVQAGPVEVGSTAAPKEL